MVGGEKSQPVGRDLHKLCVRGFTGAGIWFERTRNSAGPGFPSRSGAGISVSGRIPGVWRGPSSPGDGCQRDHGPDLAGYSGGRRNDFFQGVSVCWGVDRPGAGTGGDLGMGRRAQLASSDPVVAFFYLWIDKPADENSHGLFPRCVGEPLSCRGIRDGAGSQYGRALASASAPEQKRVSGRVDPGGSEFFFRLFSGSFSGKTACICGFSSD